MCAADYTDCNTVAYSACCYAAFYSSYLALSYSIFGIWGGGCDANRVGRNPAEEAIDEKDYYADEWRLFKILFPLTVSEIGISLESIPMFGVF